MDVAYSYFTRLSRQLYVSDSSLGLQFVFYAGWSLGGFFFVYLPLVVKNNVLGILYTKAL